MLADAVDLSSVIPIAYLVAAIMLFVGCMYITRLIPSPGTRLIAMAAAVQIVLAAQEVLKSFGLRLEYNYSNELVLGYCVFIIFGTIQFSFWLRKRMKNSRNVE